MDTNNYVLTALPSYVRYSRRELGKVSKEDRRESAFSGIRQKLSSAVISVPYGGGLDNLRLIGSLGHELQNRFTSNRRTRRKKHKNHHVSDTELLTNEIDMSPKKSLKYHDDQFSPSKLYFRKPARIGSETSTTSTATSKSRSTIYSNSENDDGYWTKKLKELDEVKERYSDNSEFLTHLYRIKKDKPKRSKKNKKQIQNQEEENEQPTMLDGVNKRLVLPPIHQKPPDTTKSRESTLTNPSDESNTSTIVAHDENEMSKRRKVEFNLIKVKRTIKLPPIESARESVSSPVKKHPRPILKKIDTNNKETRVNSFPAKNSSPVIAWQHIGKLKSPIPLPSSRKQQVTFKRNPFNLKYKCSKEFETVAVNYDTDRKASFLTD